MNSLLSIHCINRIGILQTKYITNIIAKTNKQETVLIKNALNVTHTNSKICFNFCLFKILVSQDLSLSNLLQIICHSILNPT